MSEPGPARSAPREHEILLDDGTPGFVSKRWTDHIAEAPVSDDDVVAAAPVELHAADVGTGLAILIEGPDFNLLYDGGLLAGESWTISKTSCGTTALSIFR